MFYIVGCNHGIQVCTGGLAEFDRADQNEQRAHFRGMLGEICANRRIEIVLEEDGGPEETAAEQIADRHDIPWHDITKRSRGIEQESSRAIAALERVFATALGRLPASQSQRENCDVKLKYPARLKQ